MIEQLSLFETTPKENVPVANIVQTKTDVEGFCVYEHVFPNNKKYIGVTCDPQNRWNNGAGYNTQKKIAHAIHRYGWNNIKHNIIIDGLSREQALSLEKYLIAELHTIDHGYNVSIGGERVNGTYLNPYVLEMIRFAKRNDIFMRIIANDGEMNLPEYIHSIRFDKECADFWNEANRAVCLKHGKFSSTDFRKCSEYWFHMAQYLLLHIAIETGKDVTNWEEPHYGEDSIIGDKFND